MAERPETIRVNNGPDESIRRVLRRVTIGAALFVVGTAVLVLIGWATGLPVFISLVPVRDAARMMPITAAGLLLSGSALWLLRTPETAASRGGHIAKAMAAVTALVGLAVVIEYVFGLTIGIDRLLFPATLEQLVERVPGRPALTTAIGFVAIGSALLMMDAETRHGLRPAQVLVLLPGFLGIQALAGYGYRQEVLFAPLPYAELEVAAPMAIHTAASFVILALGVLVARPDRGFISLFTGSDIGGFIGRRLLPAAIVVPLLLGWIRLVGEQIGLYGPATGVALFAVATMVAFTLLIGWIAAVVRRLEAARARAEVALRTSEERFRSIFEQAGIGIVLADADGRFLLTNPVMQRFLGYSANELEGMRFTEITHPDDIDRDADNFRELIDGTRDFYQIEKRYVRRDDSVVWGRLTASIMRDPAGAYASAVGMVEDITERKALEQERTRLTAVLEATSDFVGTATADGRVLSLNRAARGIVGVQDTEDVRRLWIADLHPPLILSRILGEGIPAAIRDGIWSGETAVRSRDGREIPVSQVILAHRNPAGEVDFLSTVMRDISDRKRREQDERFLLEASGVLTESLDENEILAAIARLLASRRADYCIVDRLNPDGSPGLAIAAHRDPAAQPLVDELSALPPRHGQRPGIGAVLETGNSERVVEVTEAWLSAAGDGAHIDLLRRLGVRSQVVVPISAHHRVLGAITLARSTMPDPFSAEDLALAEELASRTAVAVENCRLYLESRQATHTRDEVLRIVAHDLRNPLWTIGLAAESVLEQLPESMARERHKLELIDRSIQISNRLLQDLLDVARMQAGRLTVEQAPVATAALAHEAVELHRQLAEEHSLELEAELPEHLPPVAADRDRILQVFSNLIGNAIKFTPRGGHITVRADHANGAVRFSVSDTGPGIPEEDRVHLFDPFWQARPGVKGAGLGLSLSRGIVEAHGGNIDVHSEPDVGSTFWFTIPVAEIAAADAAGADGDTHAGTVATGSD
ncbi:MAG TPA: PAS domain S-box protein [Longimicrobiales bacterium]